MKTSEDEVVKTNEDEVDISSTMKTNDEVVILV